MSRYILVQNDIVVGKTYYREGSAITRTVIALWPPCNNTVEYKLPNGNIRECWISTFLNWATGVREGNDET